MGWNKLNTDGSWHQMNNGAGSGGVFRGSEGEWLGGFMYRVGNGDVHEAELRAVIQGLRLAWNLGFRKLFVKLDSAMVVQWLKNKDRSSADFILVI